MRPRDSQKLGTTQTSLQPSWRLHQSAILFTWLHIKCYLTFFSLPQRNQIKLHLRIFWDPRNVFFLPNGLKNLLGLSVHTVCVNRKTHEMRNMFGCIWTFCQTIPSFRARCKEFAWLVCHTVCVKRKTHEMQNMFGCIWTFGQTIPSFPARCD